MGSQITLFYGNIELEIDEELQAATDANLPAEQKDDGLFIFDCVDFIKGDQQSLKQRLQDFHNAVETVSFFASEKTIQIKNLQKLPKKKSPLEKIENELAAVHLFKLPWDGEQAWFDKDSLTQPPHGHNHITAKQLIDSIEPLENKTYFLQVSRAWQSRQVWISQGDNATAMSVAEFLDSKVKSKLTFVRPEVVQCVDEGSSHHFVKALVSYLQDPPVGVHFLLAALVKKETELPKDLVAAVRSQGQIRKKTVAYDDFLPVSWVISRASKKRLVFTEETAGLLIEIVGSDLTNLDHELEKLSIRYGPQSRPSAEQLIETVSHSKTFSVFLVGQYLANRDLKNALESIRTLLGEKSDGAVALMGLIGFYFRRLLKLRWLLDAGMNERQIGERLSQKSWQLRDPLAQVRKFSHIELENIIIALSDRDLSVKYAGKESRRQVEDLAFLICRGHLSGRNPIVSHWVP